MWDQSVAALKHLRAQLRLIRIKVRSGDLDWRPVSSDSELPSELVRVIDHAWLGGRSIYESLCSLERQLTAAEKVLREQRELLSLYWSRGSLAGLVALGIVVMEPGGTLRHSHLAAQILSGGLAFGVFIAGALIFRLAQIPPWTSQLGPGFGVVASWLACHIDGDAGSSGPWSAAIEALTERELSRGLSLLVDKRCLLDEWSDEQLGVARHRVAVISDILPLGELVGLGLPLVIMIFQAFV
ncbi:MAG: hypothetical protein FJ146_11245 [Deltaproteobacteria bacterium]|nr:hypothetical protein [Deltaproteobacteria bacterium]